MATIRTITRSGLVLVAAGVGLVASSPTAQATGGFGATVSLTRGLADGQVVAVETHDAAPFDTVAIAECIQGREACGEIHVLTASAEGGASVSLSLAARVGGTDCRLAEGTCVVIAFARSTASFVSVPLEFAVPMTVHVDGVATIDPKTKSITMTGTVDCFGMHAHASVTARQEKPSAREVRGAALCTGEYGTKAWSVTMPNSGPKFVPGHAVSLEVSVALDINPSVSIASDATAGSVAYAAAGR